jgi:hypothetical protein
MREISGSQGDDYEDECLLDVALRILVKVYRHFTGVYCLCH